MGLPRWWSDGVPLLGVCAAGLAGGGLAHLIGAAAAGNLVWAVTTATAAVPATWWVVQSLRRRQPGVDVIAVLALVGTLLVGEYLAGAVIAVMLASGRALEARASARATRDLHALLARSPHVVHRYVDGQLTTPALDDVVPGDLLMVATGEVVAVDGRVESGTAVLDESTLTGEPLPVDRPQGDAVRSGAVNAGSPFDLRVTTTAAEGTYAGIVRLVREAQADTAPFVRLADRYAAVFLPVTLGIAAVAWWLSGDPVRAVAVLVVATPCPLILAAPVAIVSGLSRAARRGVIVKGGGPLERLAHGTVLLFDKTGTLTEGRPMVSDIITAPGVNGDDVLRLAASLDQVSPHVLATAVVEAAHTRGLTLSLPRGAVETAGQGIHGIVEGHEIRVGKASWIALEAGPVPWLRAARRRAALDSSLLIFVGIDQDPAGAILLDDPIRSDAAGVIRRLHQAGIIHTIMVTGDRAGVADTVAAALGVDEVLAECTPASKVDVVRAAAARGPTIMVGDGVNDAPALAVASVGVAVGARGSTASSEAADVVLTVDRLDRLADAIEIAQRSRRIALQSVLAGMGLSLVAMVVAAFGGLAPTAGALLQEGIDVAVILNALRALTPGRRHAQHLSPTDSALTRRFADDHARLRPRLDSIRAAAAALASDPARHLPAVHDVYQMLTDELLPHESAEHAELYPVLARALGGSDPLGPMNRGHLEICQLTRRLGRLLDELLDTPPDSQDVQDLQQTLYGLHALLRLHFAQEEESFFTLAEPRTADPHTAGHAGIASSSTTSPTSGGTRSSGLA